MARKLRLEFAGACYEAYLDVLFEEDSAFREEKCSRLVRGWAVGSATFRAELREKLRVSVTSIIDGRFFEIIAGLALNHRRCEGISRRRAKCENIDPLRSRLRRFWPKPFNRRERMDRRDSNPIWSLRSRRRRASFAPACRVAGSLRLSSAGWTVVGAEPRSEISGPDLPQIQRDRR